jgi:hypothetical protein
MKTQYELLVVGAVILFASVFLYFQGESWDENDKDDSPFFDEDLFKSDQEKLGEAFKGISLVITFMGIIILVAGVYVMAKNRKKS